MKLTLLAILLYLVYAQVTYVTTAEVIEDGDYAEQGIRVKRQISHSKARSSIKKNLPRYVRKIRIPDYSRKRSLYSVSLTGGKVTSYTLPRIKFSKSGKYTIAKAQGGRISAQAKYKLRFTILKSSGTVKVTVKKVNLILKAYYDRKLHIKSCSSSVGSVSVKISSKFLNLFRKYLEKPLKKNLTRMLCSWTKKFP